MTLEQATAEIKHQRITFGKTFVLKNVTAGDRFMRIPATWELIERNNDN